MHAICFSTSRLTLDDQMCYGSYSLGASVQCTNDLYVNLVGDVTDIYSPAVTSALLVLGIHKASIGIALRRMMAAATRTRPSVASSSSRAATADKRTILTMEGDIPISPSLYETKHLNVGCMQY